MPGMDRRWARRAQCPRAQQYPRSARALNGRGHCIGGSPGIHAGEDVHNIETLILMGHATSGVILSTVRLAADLDYQLIVVEDGCADRDPEVHTLLMEKVFPRQGTVVSAQEMVEALAAL
jgi:nicotinamidase-related amidase